ncbi:ATP-binding protein [Butyrivibrio sp. AE2032]|uniref:ATP-binding protein n=1 Tax=Butyrivibrio sp. AE2032 TaxID=1458463 RepID=UPI0005570D2A|nr:ATP-binding protein [Butyrivibrio sp. AE2032]
MYIYRHLEKRVKYMADHFPVVLVSGARQVGKTTLLKKIAEGKKDIQYVTLDHPRIRQLAKEDPELFLQQYSAPVIIDEIQYAPELLPFIKIKVDENRQNGSFYLTGSQMFHMMKNVSESLTGRVGILSMFSLSRAETEGRENIPFLPANVKDTVSDDNISDIFERILRGSMPQLLCDPELDAEDYYGSYVQTYIERDIRNLVNIKDEGKFTKFISCVAARTSQEVNLADIAKDVEIDRKTADNWLSILVTSGIVVLVHPYSGNTIKRIIKRPKMYFMDTGLACYLSMWNNARALELSAMAGAMFENYVVSEIIKGYANNGIDVRSRLTYYRDNNGKEIDLMIIENGKIYPVEIKMSADPGKKALKNFLILDSLPEETGEGAVLCMSSVVIPLDEKNKLIPIKAI